ncbi:MAG: DUF3179 domain-containing (seleno)protein [Acidimicrobiales bacterium]
MRSIEPLAPRRRIAGIPAIDEPKFLSAGRVDFLEDEEPVMALEIGDDARAYPLQIMTWHEIVNDTVDGVPVAVTYCPLCNTAIAYDRRLANRVLDFGSWWWASSAAATP